jgi:hypothetical protein
VDTRRRLLLLLAFGLPQLACSQNKNQPATPAQSKRENTKMPNREELAKLIDAHTPGLGALLQQPGTTVERLQTPYLRNGTIDIVTAFSNSGPRTLAVGITGQKAHLLAGAPAAFLEFARAAQVQLDTASLRSAYIRAYLELTRQFHLTFRIIDSFDTLKPPNKPDARQTALYAQYLAQYAPIIKPPTLSSTEPWVYSCFAQRGESLVQITATLSPDARIAAVDRILETSDVIAYSH